MLASEKQTEAAEVAKGRNSMEAEFYNFLWPGSIRKEAVGKCPLGSSLKTGEHSTEHRVWQMSQGKKESRNRQILMGKSNVEKLEEAQEEHWKTG